MIYSDYRENSNNKSDYAIFENKKSGKMLNTFVED
jgi:hypothetical protein